MNTDKEQHLQALVKLANEVNPLNRLSKKQLYSKLLDIEVTVNAASVAQCNGEQYLDQPFRDELEWDAFLDDTKEMVRHIFGDNLPPNFHINTDPRGCALKLSPDRDDRLATKFDLESDWGRNQLLAPKF